MKPSPDDITHIIETHRNLRKEHADLSSIFRLSEVSVEPKWNMYRRRSRRLWE